MKMKLIGILVCMLLIGTAVLSVSGTVTVEKTFNPTFYGNTLYVGGSGPGNYSSIQSAINDASEGDTVFVYDDSSPYYEYIDLDKSISLMGENRETTVIDGGFEFEVIYVIANNVMISGFTLRNGDVGLYGSTNDSVISDNIFSSRQAGFALAYSSNNIFSGNTVNGCYEVGFAIYYSSNNNIFSDNVFTSIYVGVYLLGSCNGNRIYGNTVKYCFYGIWIDWSFLNIIKKNNFMNNDLSAYFENSSFNFWWRNYWDDWSSSRPRPINGTRYGPLLKTTDPWTTYDWRPAQEPYDIS
jgi:parallel beta-helix repeat protein